MSGAVTTVWDTPLEKKRRTEKKKKKITRPCLNHDCKQVVLKHTGNHLISMCVCFCVVTACCLRVTPHDPNLTGGGVQNKKRTMAPSDLDMTLSQGLLSSQDFNCSLFSVFQSVCIGHCLTAKFKQSSKKKKIIIALVI